MKVIITFFMETFSIISSSKRATNNDMKIESSPGNTIYLVN